ncbi:MAG: energy transducer TonB [Pseudomonadota bacterium]
MSFTRSPSRYGLPLLLVVAAHGVLLALLARGTVPGQPGGEVLPVALLVAAPPAPLSADLPASVAIPAAASDPAPPREPAVTLAAHPPALPAPAADTAASAAPVPAAALPSESVPAGALLAGPVAAPATAVSAAGGAPAALVMLPPRLAPGATEPPYPDAARWNREEGHVTLQLKVRADGKVMAVQVLESSGHARLDRAARDAAWRWRLLPAQREGRAVEGVLVQTLEFRLEN